MAALWGRVRAALRVFRPDGPLNSRAWAEAELAAVCQQMRGEWWRKVRSFLQDARTLTFLDRTQRLLGEAEPRPEVREAVVELWRLEQAGACAASAPAAGLRVVQGVVQRVICAKRATDWEAAYARVNVVLRGVVRASSAVECVNSVLRMQQARHRTMTPAMLDLKRLHRNSRKFRSGQRKERCPYEHLGLTLPTFDFWELLHTDPEKLSQELSTPTLAA